MEDEIGEIETTQYRNHNQLNHPNPKTNNSPKTPTQLTHLLSQPIINPKP